MFQRQLRQKMARICFCQPVVPDVSPGSLSGGRTRACLPLSAPPTPEMHFSTGSNIFGCPITWRFVVVRQQPVCTTTELHEHTTHIGSVVSLSFNPYAGGLRTKSTSTRMVCTLYPFLLYLRSEIATIVTPAIWRLPFLGTCSARSETVRDREQ